MKVSERKRGMKEGSQGLGVVAHGELVQGNTDERGQTARRQATRSCTHTKCAAP